MERNNRRCCLKMINSCCGCSSMAEQRFPNWRCGFDSLRPLQPARSCQTRGGLDDGRRLIPNRSRTWRNVPAPVPAAKRAQPWARHWMPSSSVTERKLQPSRQVLRPPHHARQISLQCPASTVRSPPAVGRISGSSPSCRKAPSPARTMKRAQRRARHEMPLSVESERR